MEVLLIQLYLWAFHLSIPKACLATREWLVKLSPSADSLTYLLTSSTLSKSTPVEMPRPCSRYRRSSVARLPLEDVAAKGHPQSGDAGVKHPDALLEAGVRVGDRHVARVMQMKGDLFDGYSLIIDTAPHNVRHVFWSAQSHGIPQRHLVAAEVNKH